MRTVSVSALFLLVAGLAWPPAVAAADAERGRALYESRCGGCHAASVHGREKRLAADFEAVRGWVRRWDRNLGSAWTDAQVDDVAAHLNERYYRHRCPPDVCTATGLLGDGLRRLASDGRPQ